MPPEDSKRRPPAAPDRDARDRATELLAGTVDAEGAVPQLAFDRLCAVHPELRVALHRCRSDYEAARSALAGGSGIDNGLRAELRTFARAERCTQAATELGRGGSSVVSRVADPQLGRYLARKVLSIDTRRALDERDRGRVRRFLSEARTVATLEHPGVLPVLAAGIDDEGRPFLETPIVRGRSLRDLLVDADRQGAWPLQRLVFMLIQVCDAVAFAHTRGVVHRDLKPENVLIGDFGAVYVVDWGLAKLVGAEEPSAADVPRRAASIGTTIDGQVLGTIPYMAPEQARGVPSEIGPASDQYSLGSILYEFLAGHAPYVDELDSTSIDRCLELVTVRAPRRIPRRAPRAPAELVAVCERAMARAPSARYRDVPALAADLRAWVDGRVVRAHAIGPIAELRKWILRNRLIAALVLLVTIVSIAGALVLAHVEARRAAALRDLSDGWLLTHLQMEAGALWPIHPDRVAAMHQWLVRAEDLVARTDLHRMLAAAAAGEERLRRTRFVEDMVAFAAAEGTMASVRTRLVAAESLARRSLVEHAAAWDRAIAAIADPQHCPQYDGLRIRPQLGLVPLGQDPGSGLWEFAHLPSGAPPRRDADDRLQIEEANGMVLVLLPGGRCWIGASAAAGNPRHHDAIATAEESPVHAVTLAPFFLAKYEMTQAQWLRATGANPSYYAPGPSMPVLDLTHPVESIDSDTAERTVRRLGLELPTEVQWEYAARGGTDADPYGRLDASVPLSAFANLADRTARQGGGPPGWPYSDELDDGWVLHAPVGRLRPNGFGLHDVIGNVWEWCRDGFGSYRAPARDGDGLRLDRSARGRIHRGGSFANSAASARVSNRDHCPAHSSYDRIGVRPTRCLE